MNDSSMAPTYKNKRDKKNAQNIRRCEPYNGILGESN